MKRWLIYNDGHLVYSFYPIVAGIFIPLASLWLFDTA